VNNPYIANMQTQQNMRPHTPHSHHGTWRPNPRRSASFLSQILVQRAWNWQTGDVGSDCCAVSISHRTGVNDLVTATWQT